MITKTSPGGTRRSSLGTLIVLPSKCALMACMSISVLPRCVLNILLLTAIFQKHQYRIQFLHRPFQLRNRIRRQFLRLRQLVGVFERFFLEPLEAVQLEVAFLHFGDREGAPAVFLRLTGLAFGSAP